MRMWDVAVKYAADWNSVKVSAAFGWSATHRRGLLLRRFRQRQRSESGCGSSAVRGGGGAPFQNFRRDARCCGQVGASILHVPSGLLALWPVSDRRTKRHAVEDASTSALEPLTTVKRQHDRRLVLQGWYQADLDAAGRHGAVG